MLESKRIYFIGQYYSYEIYKKKWFKDDKFLNIETNIEMIKPIYAETMIKANEFYLAMYDWKHEIQDKYYPYPYYNTNEYGFIIERSLLHIKKYPNIDYLKRNLHYKQWMDFKKDNGLL